MDRPYTNSHENSFGNIPDNWELVPIGDIGEVITGRTPSTKVNSYYGGPYKLISPANLSKNVYVDSAHRWITEDGLEATRVLPKDTVLVSCIGYIGKTGLTKDERSATNQQINAIICNRQFDPHFVLFQLRHLQDYLEKFARVTTVPILNKTNFESIKIPIPPLPEQRAIAQVLSTVRKAIDATEQVIAAASELKRSMMKHLFSYGPVSVDEAEKVLLKETEIGDVPEEWEISKIDDVCSVNAKNRDPSSDQPEKEFVYIDISSIESETGRILSPSVILGKEAPSRARRVVHTDDVILSTVRPYLKSFAIIPDEYDSQICSTGFAVLTNEKLASAKYIYYVSFSSIVGKQFRKRMKGANYPAINIGDVKETKIPIPSKQEQETIGNNLSLIDKKINVEIQRKTALEFLFNGLLQNLMTGNMRVDSGS
ncbi:MAG TPA: hypothetical protein DCL08_04830 [Anaerolineaceae bacterium]|nr:hypothetical protein [Anaerolineaceae bacterium]